MNKIVIEELEARLDSFDAKVRREALEKLAGQTQTGEITLPRAGREVNLHCHTFFSYNCYGYSPSKFAWLARKRGLAVVQIVDFDVLEGLEEFLRAGELLGLKVCGGIETRVFVPEFAGKEITSPGEPGITYHMGVGFPTGQLKGKNREFQQQLQQTAQQRNRELLERVNAYLEPAAIDYDKDVLPLTPAGNPTERHMCVAYARRARQVFLQDHELRRFWLRKVGLEVEKLELGENKDFLNLLRTRTMKHGGVGYVQPDAGAFVKVADMNRFVREAGGIPTHTWLNGLSQGEREMEKLLATTMSSGAAALNVIPDRNYAPGVKDEKIANLYAVVELAQKLHLPMVMGTEMNSPGQKFVDDFASEEIKPLTEVFLKGAHIVYAHSVLERAAGLGYCSAWAAENFAHQAGKNEFYEQVGILLEAGKEDILHEFDGTVKPKQILAQLKKYDN